MDAQEQSRLRADILKADLDAHRKLETWGSSLFLGALGLLAKQLTEWDLNPDQTKRIVLPTVVVIFPSIVGLTAFVFLRIVNYRSHRASIGLLRLAGDTRMDGLRLGMLGWVLALMPGALGYLISVVAQ